MATEDKFSLVVDKIWSLVEPVVEAEGMELIEVEYRRESHGWVLRLFIDREDGVTVEDCSQMSRVVGDLLDVSDPIHHPYHLEVSSPGLDRPLRKPRHFEQHVGSVIEARTAAPIMPEEKRRRFKGVLTHVGPDHFQMSCDGRRYEIPFASLEKARLCYFESLDKRDS